MYPISMVNFCAVVSYTNKAKKEFCLPVVVTDIGEKIVMYARGNRMHG